MGHCGVNPYQPNATWPQKTLQAVIDWVENGNAPPSLEGSGTTDTICKWPLRPQWSEGGSNFSCIQDQASIDSFTYDLDAYKLPVY